MPLGNLFFPALIPLTANNLCLINSNLCLPGFLSQPLLLALPFPGRLRCLQRAALLPALSQPPYLRSAAWVQQFKSLVRRCFLPALEMSPRLFAGSASPTAGRAAAAQSQGPSRGPFRKLAGPGLTCPSPVYFSISGPGLFPHPSLLCALPPRLITRSGVLETGEQQPGERSSPICFHSLISFSSCLLGWWGRETLQPPPLPRGCGGAEAAVSMGRSGPAFHTGRYFHTVNGLWPQQPGPSV